MSDILRPRSEVIPLLIALVLAVVLLFLGGAAHIVILSLLLSYILDPVVSALEARGMSRTLATAIILVTLTATMAAGIALLVPAILHQIQSLQSESITAQTASAISEIESFARERLSFMGMGDINLPERIAQMRRDLAGNALGFFINNSFSLLIDAVTIPFMMFFFIKDGREMKKALVSMVPNRYFEFTLDLLDKMDIQLGSYLRGQFVDAVAFGTMAVIALWILGVNYFIFLGVFAGFANLIPYVGPIAGVIPAAIVAVLGSGTLSSALPVIIAYAILKLLDDFLVAPFAVASSVEMHPLLVLIAIMVGGELFGILGMLLAVPTTGFMKVVLKEGVSTYRKYRFT